LSRDEQKQRSRDRMINLLLQGIIAANPHHDPTVTDEVRLARAREALLGETLGKGRTTIREDMKLFPLIEEALKAETDKMKRAFVGTQRPETQAEWQRELAEEPKSMRGIAKEHLSSFAKPSVQPASTVDWLRRALAKLDLTAQDMAELEGLFYGDSPKAERLQRIFGELRALGIDTVSPLGTESTDMTPKQE
jgi:hypothetical protein